MIVTLIFFAFVIVVLYYRILKLIDNNKQLSLKNTKLQSDVNKHTLQLHELQELAWHNYHTQLLKHLQDELYAKRIDKKTFIAQFNTRFTKDKLERIQNYRLKITPMQ